MNLEEPAEGPGRGENCCRHDDQDFHTDEEACIGIGTLSDVAGIHDGVLGDGHFFWFGGYIMQGGMGWGYRCRDLPVQGNNFGNECDEREIMDRK